MPGNNCHYDIWYSVVLLWYNQYSLEYSQYFIVVLVMNYGVSNTIVLKIP